MRSAFWIKFELVVDLKIRQDSWHRRAADIVANAERLIALRHERGIFRERVNAGLAPAPGQTASN
jgi:hypothetical protein